MNLKKIGKVFTSKFVGTGPSSYEKKNLPGRGLTKFEKHCSSGYRVQNVSAYLLTCLGFSHYPRACPGTAFQW